MSVKSNYFCDMFLKVLNALIIIGGWIVGLWLFGILFERLFGRNK